MMLSWAHERGITLRLIEPGKPNQNAYVESFNGRFRDECLNEHWFTSLAHAQVASRLAAGVQRGATEEGTRRTDARRLCQTAENEASDKSPPDSKADCYLILRRGDVEGTPTTFMLGLPHSPAREAAMSPTELTKVRDALAGALSVDEVNQVGRETGQAIRLRTVTPHRLFLAVVRGSRQRPRGVARGIAPRVQSSAGRRGRVQGVLQPAGPRGVHPVHAGDADAPPQSAPPRDVVP